MKMCRLANKNGLSTHQGAHRRVGTLMGRQPITSTHRCAPDHDHRVLAPANALIMIIRCAHPPVRTRRCSDHDHRVLAPVGAHLPVL